MVTLSQWYLAGRASLWTSQWVRYFDAVKISCISEVSCEHPWNCLRSKQALNWKRHHMKTERLTRSLSCLDLLFLLLSKISCGPFSLCQWVFSKLLLVAAFLKSNFGRISLAVIQCWLTLQWTHMAIITKRTLPLTYNIYWYCLYM